VLLILSPGFHQDIVVSYLLIEDFSPIS